MIRDGMEQSEFCSDTHLPAISVAATYNNLRLDIFLVQAGAAWIFTFTDHSVDQGRFDNS